MMKKNTAIRTARLHCYLCLSAALSVSPGSKSTVNVSVTKRIPDVSPADVRKVWLDYIWKQGGGLPLLVIMKDKSEAKGSPRTLVPLFAEETLLDSSSNDDEEGMDTTLIQKYKLTDLGPVWKSEIEPDSHLGKVSFAPFSNSNDENKVSSVDADACSGTDVTWDVTFNTLNRQDLWQSVTENSISDACENLASYLLKPILLTSKLRIQVPDDSDSTTKSVLDKWFDFCWKDGGGLPNPIPPIPLSKDGYDRILIPPFLREKIFQINHDVSDEKKSEIIYTVANPSSLTYPVHTHLGRLTFQAVEGAGAVDELDLIWEVNIRPYRGSEAFVNTLTETILSIYMTCFKTHMERPGEMVDVYAPRGKMKGKGPLFQVNVDSWLGGVLETHLNDDRPVAEQTADLLQPLKWGIQYDGLSSEWTTKDISDEIILDE